MTGSRFDEVSANPQRRGHGPALLLIRTTLGWNKAEVGRMLDVSAIAVGKFEKGRPPHARHFLTYSGLAARAGLPALALLLALV